MEMRDYFLSYNKNNSEWAKWVADNLRSHGVTVHFAETDIKAGMPIIDWMSEALKRSKGLIAIWSLGYKDSNFCRAELRAAYQKSCESPPYNLLIARVSDAAIDDPLFQTIAHADLLSPYESKNRETLLDAVRYQMGRLS